MFSIRLSMKTFGLYSTFSFLYLFLNIFNIINTLDYIVSDKKISIMTFCLLFNVHSTTN